MEKIHCVYLSLGTNLGQRQENIHKALKLLGERAGKVDRVSSIIETQPWGFSSPNAFLNCCVKLLTSLEPLELLHVTQQIERDLGRKEKSHNGEYHDRLIDIDILLYDDLHISTPELTIPHPLMREREFVMKPLNEILNCPL